MAKSECECCKRFRTTVVSASVFGPVSHAYCRECIDKPAEPFYTFQYLYDYVSHEGNGLHPWVERFYTWRDDWPIPNYQSWPDYVKERRDAATRIRT